MPPSNRLTGGLSRTGAISLLGLVLLLSLGPLRAADPPGPHDDSKSQEAARQAADVAALKAAKLPTDGPGLLAFLRKHTLSEEARQRIEALIALLGDDDYETRQKASESLLALGLGARPRLVEALKHEDLEVQKRSEVLLKQIPAPAEQKLLPAVVRQVGRLAPAGAAEVLLDYLPEAEDQELIEEITRSLARVAGSGSKPEPALVAALDSGRIGQRLAAVEVLARIPGQRSVVHKMLRDPSLTIRLRTGILLYEARDRAAIPALIGLLAKANRYQRFQIEDRLRILAGSKAPSSPDSDTAEGLRKYQLAWERWWKTHGQQIDLSRVDLTPRFRGYTLVVSQDATGSTGRVQELDRDGKVLWEIAGLRYPTCAQVVGIDRVLICEYTAQEVSERTFKGEILWQRRVTGLALSARRLANGNTLIVTRQEVLEIDRDGKEVFKLVRPGSIQAAHRDREGNVHLITVGGTYERVDEDGKIVKSFPIGRVSTIGHRTEFLPNGHLLVPQYSQSKVTEYDADGKVVWEVSVPRPNAVTRLPNGHTLVAGRLNRRIIELDQEGKEVWSHTTEGRPMFIDRR